MVRVLFLILYTQLSLCLFSQPYKSYPIKNVRLQNVQIIDGFWKQRYDTNKNITIPHILKQLKDSDRIENLLFASGIKEGIYCTRYPFDESDIYKTIEAASYILMSENDQKLSSRIDSLIELIAKVQEDDGYIYSARRVPSEYIKKAIGDERWSNLQWSHELYNVGHLYEAAVAHFNATGKDDLLKIAFKNAELILSDFGSPKLEIPPGHQEIELGLVRLYEVTNDERYVNLAKYFLDIRGKGQEINGRNSWGEYAQDHLPVIEQKEAVGHAVRAAYMYSAMTDVAAILDIVEYKNAINHLWENVITKKLYITGGIGSTGSGEALGPSYELPNFSAYNETCSSIANMMWNFRMYRLYGEAKYLDVFERTLYNAFLSGVGMEGDRFFYPNPLASYGSQTRAPWFTCACCPPNIARFIASLPSKLYSTSENKIYINLYSASKAEINLEDKKVGITQETNYPWDGRVKLILSLNEESEFKIMLRIPGWLTGKPLFGDLYKFMEEGNNPSLFINGRKQNVVVEDGFVELGRNWRNGDTIELDMPMYVHKILANENVKMNNGKIALQRGPIVYCLEWPENGENFVDNFLINTNAKLNSVFRPELLNGVQTINGKAINYLTSSTIDETTFIAIPYYAWAHRGKGEMSVWINCNEKNIKPVDSQSLISQSQIYDNLGLSVKNVNDQIDPIINKDADYYKWNSGDESSKRITIIFPDTSEVSVLEIFWAGERDDKILPNSWKIEYQNEQKWNDVYPIEDYNTVENEYSYVAFETVKSKRLRISIDVNNHSEYGIHEIKVK